MNSAREHYEEAERLLALARREQDSIRRGLILAEAQVHATLALSAPAGKDPPGPGEAQAGSSASTGEARPVVPAGGAESLVLPHVPPWATTHPTWRDDPAPTAPPVVTGKRTPTEKLSVRRPAEPRGDPSPSPPVGRLYLGRRLPKNQRPEQEPDPAQKQEPDPGEQKPGPAGQSPAAGSPGQQEPGGPAPSFR